MKIDDKDLLNSILSSLNRIDYIKPDDIPNIDLYMDQVTTFMNEQLAATRRYPDDKILTKTMINNYTKNNLLPPPDKKKYSKEHLLTLIFIYYFKGILSISDIQHLLNPITDRYFSENGELDLTAIYKEVFSLEKDEAGMLAKDITRKFNTSSHTFPDAPQEERENLQLFSFLCMLSFDVYVKRMLIEKIIDAKLAGKAEDKPRKSGKENRKK
ncbi:MAG: DUF1836 domain-containing protein [Eubacterium sp.]|nr:DUF1836 domain-containing protein [Eubacterium sp.]